jgi:hypothetical protein
VRHMRPGGWREVVGGDDRDDFVALSEPGPSRARQQDAADEREQNGP